MSELAGYLLAAGITSSRFQRISREAYFRAAARNAKFRNQRVNQSAVAARTGLTRLQIREFANSASQKPSETLTRLQRIVRGWETDPLFVTTDLVPKPLAVQGRKAPFSLLVKKYGGSRSNRPVINQLLRHGLVTCDGEFIKLKRHPTKQRANLQRLLRLLKTLVSRGDEYSKPTLMRTVVREITYPSPSPKGREILNRKTIQSVSVFLSELQAAGRAAAIETPVRTRSKVSKTRLVLLTEELEQQTQFQNTKDFK